MGHSENIKTEGNASWVEFYPIQNSKFVGFQPPNCKFDAGKNLKFPENIISFDTVDFFIGPMDFSRARGSNFPLIIHMVNFLQIYLIEVAIAY